MRRRREKQKCYAVRCDHSQTKTGMPEHLNARHESSFTMYPQTYWSSQSMSGHRAGQPPLTASTRIVPVDVLQRQRRVSVEVRDVFLTATT
eukprot:SAG22_NODE_2673_length_2317_cov_2.330929_1_plen_91_part_00